MAGDWATTTLRDDADLLTGFPFKSDGYTEASDGIRLLRGDNIVQASLRWDGVKRWPKDSACEHAAYQLAEGDVVLAMDRPWIEAGLKYASIGQPDLPCLLVQRTARLRGKERLDTAFLRYLIGSRPFTQHVLAVQTGTTVPHISGRQILDFEFLLPPLPEQKRIAHVLGTLDDKIELNRRMNATLEGISRALFKSWFVDFDPVRQKAAGQQPDGMDAQTAALFPDSFENSEIGEVPKGWTVQPLDRMASVAMGLSPKGESYNDAGNGVPLINGPVEFGAYFPERTKWTTAASRVAASDDLIMCVRGSTTGRRVVSDGDYAIGRGVCAIRASREFHTFLYETMSHALARLLANTTGSVFPSLSAPDIKGLAVLVPSNEILEFHHAVVNDMTRRVQANHVEASRLAALRDTLLPKLLSGEIRVPEAEEAVGEAGG